MSKKKSVGILLLTFILLIVCTASAVVGALNGEEIIHCLNGLHSSASKESIPQASYRSENSYMQIAIDEARVGIYNAHGGPFGTVIVKDGQIVGQGHNHVLVDNDSTAHGEIYAIRETEKALGTYDLSGCVLYTTGEPCPMCLAACMWANIDHVYYGCTIADNEIIGFRDKKFDSMFGGREAFDDYLTEIDRESCLKLFEEYSALNATIY